MTAMEFLNIVGYARAKADGETQKIEQWKRTH